MTKRLCLAVFGGFACLLVAATTSRAGEPDITLNEILYRPPLGLDDAEFIELYHRGAGGDVVDLAGWTLGGGVSYTFPGGTSLAAGEYLLVVKDLALADALYAGTTLLGPYSGSLSNGGERISIANAAGVLIDELAYDDGEEFPSAADGTGASLEKRSPELDPWYGDNWAASVTLLGSPGKLNTQFREIVDVDLVLVGEDWRYLRGTAEPTALAGEWAQPAFDASAWEVGPTGIGYGDDDDATLLADMAGLYTTIYARRPFDVADPARVESLTLLVDYDDGFVVYLNGVEAARRNVGGAAGTPLPFDAVALGNHEAGAPEAVDLSASIPILAAGANVIAIHGVNQGLASTDFSLAPALSAQISVVGTETSLNRLATSSVVPSGAAWRYFRGTTEPSVDPGAWATPAFDAAGWQVGLAGFGYGDNDDVTVLGDMQNGYSTLYLRHEFVLEELPDAVGMALGINYDDGFIAYLNGVEVARANAPGSPGDLAAFNALATANHEATGEETIDLGASLGLLALGTNVLAVHGLNATLDSSDFTLSPRLTLTTSVAGDPEAILLGVSVNEVYAPGGGGGWIEVLNGCCDAVDLGGFRLGTGDSGSAVYTFPAPTLLAPGAFLEVSETALGFPLPATATLLLTDPAGVVLVDGKTYDAPDPLLSAGSYPDGDGDPQILASPTPGSANVAPPDFGVVLNEIMYHPLAAPGAVELEWVELCNRSAVPVDVGGWSFTRGIDYEIPPATVIAPGGYLVVAREPLLVEAEYAIAGVIGGHGSGLKNDDELVLLRDHLGNEADRVHYADDGRWDGAADGAGPSLELIHPDLDNRSGLAWRASAGDGTPGAQNSVFSTSAAPIVSRVRHAPLVPVGGQPVTVNATVSGLSPVVEARLFHRVAVPSGSPANPFTQVVMQDDGASGDGAANDGVFGGTIPGQPLGAVVEFFIEVEDALAEVRVVPATAPAQNNLYVVDLPPADLGVPAFRVVMTPEDRFELESRSVQSDVLLGGTLLHADDVYYGVGVRYRGKSSRLLTPKSYRVELTDDEEFHGTKRVNLNANRPQHQFLGMKLFRHASVPASLARLVRFVLNDDAPRTYCHMEAVDEDLLARLYPEPEGEDDGNLYRGIENGDLDYRGEDPEDYRPSYEKQTNEEEDDWSDLIALSDALTNTPEADLPAVLPGVIDVDEWLRFFATHALISTQEGGISRDRGDDYFAYRRPSDGLWVLIPWDLDDSFVQPTERLFRPTLFQIARILQHPDWAPGYYRHLVELGSTHFSAANMASELARLEGLVPQGTLNADGVFVGDRLAFLDARINLTFDAQLGSSNLVSRGAEWRFFRGVSEPSGGTLDWTAPGFDDSAWESGPTGIGYGDGDDATVLADMQNLYSSVYLRHEFEVDDPGELSALQLAIDFDDGFVAFLNGVEIGRANAGGAGTYPTFDALATAEREAGSPQTFDFEPAGLIVPGSNVLAVVGLNVSLDSSDLSLIPELRLGGVVGEACPGDFFVSGGQLVLEGLAPVTQTRRVLVDGVEAEYDFMTGAWSFSAPLVSSSHAATIEVLDAASGLVASQTITVTRASTLGGTLGGDTVLLAAASPYLVVGTLTVPSGVSLTIEAGCELLIEEGVNLFFDGQVQALGSEEAPIIFTRLECHENWGYMRLQSNRNDNVFNYCEISRATGNPGGITVRSSNIELNHCHLDRIAGEGINSSGSTNTIRHTLVERTNEGLSLDFGVTIVEYSTVRNVVGKSDLIDANGSNNPPARIAFNLIHGTSDDGIDADRGAVFAEANIIRNCGDQAISLVGSGSSTVIRNVCFDCTHGLSVKNGHVCVAEFNTFVYNTQTGVRAIERTPGNPGGIITLRNSIVWGNGTPLFVNSDGVITTTYSNVQGALVPGVGNISADPLFVDAANDDYHLQAGSPCIGAADNGDDMGAYPFEITPRAPSDLTVTGATGDSITLGWRDNSFAENSYELERRTSAGFTPEALIAPGETWRFFRGVSEPSAGTLDWTTATFDDTGWEEGPTGIGYGDGDDATVLADMQNGYTTVYLRKTFEVLDASAIQSLELRIDFDDGFVAYVNGVEVARQFAGRPGLDIPFDGVAEGSREAGETVSIEFSTDGILADGTNVLALHGLNTTIDSSDLSIIPELRTTDPAPFVTIASLPPDTLVYVDAGLIGATRYSYRARALNVEGASGYSNIVSQDTIDIPAAPTGLIVTGIGATSISLAWTDNSDVEESYVVERADDDDSGFVPLPDLPADTEVFTDEGLLTGETYRYRVRAVNTFGSSPFSNTVTQTTGTPPEAPSGLVIAAVFVDALELGWVDNATDETAYEVEVRVGGATFQQRAVLAADAIVYLDEELDPGETYTYRVRAVNLIGPSAYSNEATGETGRTPQAPADLTVTGVTLDEISLSWVDASDNEEGFELERRAPGDLEFQPHASLPAGATAYTDLGLEPDTTYEYRVYAANLFGPSGFSNVASATTGRLPAAPSGLTVVGVGLDTVDLAWIDNADNEDGYELERREGAGPFAKIADLAVGASSFLDAGLVSGAAYGYRVRAVNGFGPSAFSATATATTGRLPEAPSGLLAIVVTTDTATISWIDNADNESSFEIERSDAGAGFVTVGSQAPDATMFSDSGLAPGTEYAYRVRAVNAFGASAPSDTLLLMTGSAPAAPTGLAVTDVGLGSAMLSWLDNADNESSFELERRSGAGAFVKVADLPADATSHLDEGLSAGTSYTYRVRAVNEFGPSGYSNEAMAATGSLPVAPENLRLDSVTVDSATFSWVDLASDETRYEVERRRFDGPFEHLADLSPGAEDFTDAGLVAGTEYTYRVRAVNIFGASDWSNELTVTLGAPPAAPVDLAVVAVTASSVELAWTDLAGDETGYEVERRAGGEVGFVRIAELPAGAEEFLDDGLAAGLALEYRVRAVNAFGPSGYAGPVVAMTSILAPRIDSIGPAEGSTLGGTVVTIRGANLTSSSAVTFGGTPASEVVHVGDDELLATAPPAASPGAVDVEVVADGGSISAPDGFVYFLEVLRGDTNNDGARDLSDAVALMNYLFLGGPAPRCDDVARINTDASIDLSDALFLLNWLFLGGSTPQPELSRCY